MERIVYRKTLDVHKNGIQFTLQGFETADNKARRIEINLMASGDTIDLPLEQLVALMYVTTPNATEPSINECTIKDNTIIYDVLPIVEEGITEMQLKLIDSRPEGANGVLASPKFAIEVSESGTNDDGAMQSTTYTALENALAMAKGVYDSRVVSVEIDSDCTFRVVYADGTTYESEVLKELYLKGESILSQSYARGGTGTRAGEDTDNSMYYSNVSRSASAEATKSKEEAIGLLEETKLHGVYTAFSIDFESGEVKYISPAYKFKINQENGELEALGKAYTPEETVELVVTEWLEKASGDIAKINSLAEKEYVDEELEKIKSGYVTKSEFSTFGVDCVKELDYQTDKAATDEKITNLESNLENLATFGTVTLDNHNGDTWACEYEKRSNGIVEIWGKVVLYPLGNIGQTGGVYQDSFELIAPFNFHSIDCINITIASPDALDLSQNTHLSPRVSYDSEYDIIRMQVVIGDYGDLDEATNDAEEEFMPIYVRIIGHWE